MRDHSKHIQVDRYRALELILENSNFSPRTECVPVNESVGRVLAEDVYSRWDSPNCLTCRMDSVAVHWDDFKNGMPDTSEWVRGVQWEFANTGVAMPEGFDTAIVVEHVIFSENDTKVAFDAMPSGQFAGTSAPGSKLKKGELMVLAGSKITPLLAAYITSGNNKMVNVLAKPKVAFIPTGGELVEVCDAVPLGKNIESNSVMIAAKIRQWGGEPVLFDVVPDEQERIREALYQAAEQADIVVLNAGSSKGNDDWGIEMLEEIGTILYHQTCHGPGHHSSFGVLDGTPVVGISGPPGGAAFTADFYVWPVVQKYLGQDPKPAKMLVRVGEEFGAGGPPMAQMKSGESPAPKAARGEDRPMEGGDFYSVRQLRFAQAEDGVIEAFPLQGGGHPNPLVAESADAYYLMPSGPGKKAPAVGDIIEVELRR